MNSKGDRRDVLQEISFEVDIILVLGERLNDPIGHHIFHEIDD